MLAHRQAALRTNTHEFAVANSRDLFVHHPATAADLTRVVMTDDSSGYVADVSWRVMDIDVAALGQEAIDKALHSRAHRCSTPASIPSCWNPMLRTMYLRRYPVPPVLCQSGKGEAGLAAGVGNS